MQRQHLQERWQQGVCCTCCSLDAKSEAAAAALNDARIPSAALEQLVEHLPGRSCKGWGEGGWDAWVFA
eukprot:1161348-Pelagomonas_calceolata.AAC.4